MNTLIRRTWKTAGYASLALILSACTSMGVGLSVPIGPANVGVGMGSDGSLRGGVGVGVGGASVGVGGTGRLPASSPTSSTSDERAHKTQP